MCGKEMSTQSNLPTAASDGCLSSPGHSRTMFLGMRTGAEGDSHPAGDPEPSRGKAGPLFWDLNQKATEAEDPSSRDFLLLLSTENKEETTSRSGTLFSDPWFSHGLGTSYHLRGHDRPCMLCRHRLIAQNSKPTSEHSLC